MGDALKRIQRIQRRVEAFRKLAPVPQQAPARCSSLAALPLLDFVPAASPHLESPRHLAPYVERLDATLGQSVELVFAAPPQHGKTEATKHALAKWMLAPGERRNFVYVTYSQTRADSVARDFRLLAEHVGLEPVGRLAEWTSATTGARVMFTSIGGALTGYPLDGVILIDDPIKDPAEARSRATRDGVWSWLFGAVLTRRHPGSSMITMATRWHEDDPSGRLVREWHIPYVNLQAICEDPATDPVGRAAGEALWPERRPLEFLEQMRGRDPWGFAAMYQGSPRPRGGEVFSGEPARFIELPPGGYHTAYGVDLAYTAKTHADRSVCMRCQRIGDVTFVTACRIAQVAAPEFLLTLAAMRAEMAGPFRWYASGTEKGSAQFIQRKVPGFKVLPASADKFQRAVPVAAGWNAGKVALPDEGSPYFGPWVDQVIDEVSSFTGVADARDDVVDALAAGWDELNPIRSAGGAGFAVQDDFTSRSTV